MRCRDRRWCRAQVCGREGYKPANFVFRATVTSLEFLAATQIYVIGQFNPGDLDDEDDVLLTRFEDAVIEGLLKAMVAPQDQDEYFRDDLGQGLGDVREELVRAARATPELLGSITRVMNEV